MLIRPAAALAGLTVAACLTLAGCGSDSGTAADPSADTSSTSSTSSGVACDYPSAGSAAKEVDPPPATATMTGTVSATISTNVGDLKVGLDADTTPCTVNSFVSLAEQGYFDDTTCHRLTTSGILVLQCGDPTASGMGGPGYSFDDELDSLPKADSDGTIAYPAGTLAMANAGPSTNGSQFFVVYGDSRLPPAYTVFGQLDAASVKIVEGVAAKGTSDGGPDGAPKQPVDISAVTVDGS